MKLLKNILPLLLLLVAGQFAQGQKSGMKSSLFNDTFADESYVSRFVRYQKYYSFIKYNENYFEWANVKAVDNIYAKLARANNKKVNILHIGDSHIQADFYTGYVRENIQKIFGYGGRGFIFPYACAGTHSTYDYRTWKYGNWDGARNVKNPNLMDIGITGAVASTTDEKAGFKFGFKEGILMPEFTTLKIYCKKDSQSFNLKLKLANYPDTIYLNTNARPNSPYIRVELPIVSDTFEVFVDKTDSTQTFFECYGLMIESCKDKGVTYSSVGINGAGFGNVLAQTLFEGQVQELKPDLVVIDLGANDFYGFNYNEFELRTNLESLINTIKKASPKASILISCSQDIYYRRRKNVYATHPFSKLIQTTAKANDAIWYDYFAISGGRYSMQKWRRYHLAKNDKVHLTTAGYNLKGDLFLNAMLNSYLEYLKGRPESLIVANGGLKTVNDSLFNDKNGITDPENDSTKTQIVYKVKKGEYLSSIAKRYDLDIEDIMDWNGLEKTYLYYGQKLTLYVDKTTATKPQATASIHTEPKTTPKPSTTPVKGIKYRVKSGDTLWDIAQRHGISVAEIKKLNNLRGDAIRAGQTLVISK